ncbi:MAG: helix-turn-helix transcriptional regulator [Kofleriaceae bacterium]
MPAPQQLRSLQYRREVSIEFDDPDPPDLTDLRSLAEALDRQVPPSGDPRGVVRSVWRGLLAGQWALLDSFEHGERWFVVARKSAAPDPHLALTDREQQVLGFAVRGHSNKWAALELGLTSSTIATHLRRAMTKLGLGSRAQLVQALPLAAEADDGTVAVAPRSPR